MSDWLTGSMEAHIAALRDCVAAESAAMDNLAARLTATLRGGGKLLVCGNGGSACDAMHIAGEFVGRFTRERAGFPAIALSADAGILTAVGNDYGFDSVFSRQVEAYGQPGDVLIALSTSGRSPNVLKALEMARTRGLHSALFTGSRGQDMAHVADQLIVVPATETARVQEVHIFLLHLLADRVEAALMESAA
jgi:D-sedoheptulose 7-phosphate isomerase